MLRIQLSQKTSLDIPIENFGTYGFKYNAEYSWDTCQYLNYYKSYLLILSICQLHTAVAGRTTRNSFIFLHGFISNKADNPSMFFKIEIFLSLRKHYLSILYSTRKHCISINFSVYLCMGLSCRWMAYN